MSSRSARPGKAARLGLGVRHAGICLCLGLLGCAPEEAATPGSAALQVSVVEVTRTDVPLHLDMVGTTLGTQDVPIRARVEGFLESMDFQEGGNVKKGELLYTIDPQPFQAKLVQAQSQLAAQRTALAKAASDLARIRPLAEMKAVSQQDLDGAVAQEEAARAAVQAAEAAVKLAEIELSYTRIHAPISGRIGLTQARPGEFVGREPNPVVLNVLSNIDPIRVRFSISEQDYLIFARRPAAGRDGDPTTRAEADLELLLADGSRHPHKGRGVAMAQSVNPETGTFAVEALFPNPEGILLPGQFARVRALYEVLHDVPVVPRRAIVELQGRFRVYRVAEDNTVVVVEVEPGPIIGSDQVITSGLAGGETIIVEGVQKVRPGMTVAPTPLSPRTQSPLES